MAGVLSSMLAACAAPIGTAESSARDRGDRERNDPTDDGRSNDEELEDREARDPPEECRATLDRDRDGDGYRGGEDCNECSANVNAGAYDLPGNGVDEDCDGRDAREDDCGEDLRIDSTRPEDAARALGLCRFVDEDEPGWGVVSARYVRADGQGEPDSFDQIGLLPDFAGAARSAPFGGHMLALSSGVARAPHHPGYTSQCDDFGARSRPPHRRPDVIGIGEDNCAFGFFWSLLEVAIYNSVALELRVRVPSNANGFRFATNFFTHEYPEFVCSPWNDFFVVLRETDRGFENITFDRELNPISVNNGLLEACTPGTHGGRRYDCPLGRGSLTGTGFDGTSECAESTVEFQPGGCVSCAPPSEIGGATGWLKTTAPAEPGEIMTLRFAIWDTGDSILDSLVLIDGFEWEAQEGTDAGDDPRLPPPPENETEPDPLI